jgi:hypothetical protein
LHAYRGAAGHVAEAKATNLIMVTMVTYIISGLADCDATPLGADRAI